MKKDFWVPVIALFAICLVAAILLGATNFITADKIAQTAYNQKQESLKQIFPDATSFSDEQTYNADGVDFTYYDVLDNNENTLGKVFICSSKGYGGQVEVMTGISADTSVKKVIILSMNDETPGLGQNASKPDFLDQFAGKTGNLSWVKQDPDKNQIQGVTSATFTSKAVISCVNASLSAFEQINGGAN